jgi:hypothetical protein
MTEERGHELAEIGVRLVDDAYMAWVIAENESDHALHDWFMATAGRRAAAFCSYRAALDREEAAARDLQRLSELTGSCWDHCSQHLQRGVGSSA